ncbi:MAG: hypothetical protein M0Z95_26750 [Actinomycetota bacterium]|jgi:uncharacterized membrane protein|nr:hypothetical protein [Actinomycetota bacterium]
MTLTAEVKRESVLASGSSGWRTPPSHAHRVISVLAAIGLAGPAFSVWAGIIEVPGAGAFAVLLSLASMVLAVGAASARSRRAMVVVDVGVLLAGVGTLLAWSAIVLAVNPSYGTDEAAFVQYAAQLFLHGKDPYGANLIPALNQFGVPLRDVTLLLNGHFVNTFGYPGWSILVTAPFIFVTGGVQSVIVANLMSAVIAVVIAFAILPQQWRGLAVVAAVDFSVLFHYVVGGVIGFIALPALVLIAWRWTEVGSGGRLGWRGRVAAVAMGLAVATNQLAWFLAPFVVVGIFICRRRELGARRGVLVLVRYLSFVAATFGAVNLPFIVMGPKVWLEGVLGPLTQHAIPYGQGFVDLATFVGVGGGDLQLFSGSAILIYLGLLTVLVLRFDHLWRAAPVLPSIALWWPTRSLAEYWLTLIVVWAVALTTTSPPAPANAGQVLSGKRRLRSWALAGALAPGVALAGLTIAFPSPLRLQIVAVRTNGQFGRVWQMRVRETNTTSRRLTPHFGMDASGQMTSYWSVVMGPTMLEPHSTATVTLDAPNVGSMPGITSRFELEAVTNNPETVSVSKPYTAEPYQLRLTPGYFAPVPLGDTIRIRVELRSAYGAPVHRAGVPVFLGQVIYGEAQLIPSEASIDGHPEGQSPVENRTNRLGIATFSVRATQLQGSPIYFQAWAVGRAGFPFGYSPIVSEAWTGK